MIRSDGWLPIGSVVHLGGEQGLYLVIACMQRDAQSGRIWDYSGLRYPMGFTDPDSAVLFDKDSIDGLYFIGLQDSDGLRYQDMLESIEGEYQKAKAASIAGDRA